MQDEINPVYHQAIKKALLTMEIMVYGKDGLKFSINGTVFSGHPTRTTLFNTL